MLVLGSRGLETFAKYPVSTVQVELDSNPREVNWDTLEREVAAYEEGSQGCLPQMFPVTTWKVKITGENQEVGIEMKNYSLTEIQTFIDFMQQEGQKGADWQVFGTGSQVLLTAAKMCQLAGISKNPKIHNLPQDASGL